MMLPGFLDPGRRFQFVHRIRLIGTVAEQTASFVLNTGAVGEFLLLLHFTFVELLLDSC